MHLPDWYWSGKFTFWASLVLAALVALVRRGLPPGVTICKACLRELARRKAEWLRENPHRLPDERQKIGWVLAPANKVAKVGLLGARARAEALIRERNPGTVKEAILVLVEVAAPAHVEEARRYLDGKDEELR